VDLSFAGLFEREMPGAAMGGGLLDLDQALSGALARLRASGDFTAEPMDTLLLERLPHGVRARTIMLIGLGDPTKLQADLLERATRVAFREASRLRAGSVAFAPSLLDTGLKPEATAGAPLAMMAGLLSALATQRRLAEAGLGLEPTVSRWSFDAGASHVDAVAKAFKVAFDAFGRDGHRLSPRQLACLRLVAAGKTTLEIAAELGISNRTVEQYVADACARLGVRTRIEAVVKSVRLGLISDQPSVI